MVLVTFMVSYTLLASHLLSFPFIEYSCHPKAGWSVSYSFKRAATCLWTRRSLWFLCFSSVIRDIWVWKYLERCAVISDAKMVAGEKLWEEQGDALRSGSVRNRGRIFGVTLTPLTFLSSHHDIWFYSSSVTIRCHRPSSNTCIQVAFFALLCARASP